MIQLTKEEYERHPAINLARGSMSGQNARKAASILYWHSGAGAPLL